MECPHGKRLGHCDICAVEKNHGERRYDRDYFEAEEVDDEA